MSAPIPDAPEEPTTPSEPEPQPTPAEPTEHPKVEFDGEFDEDRAKRLIENLRSEKANLQTQLADQAPLVQAAKEAEEAQKTELQRANERAEQLANDNNRLLLEAIAAKHGIAEEDYDLLGSGTREELESRAQRLAARTAPAPTVDAAPPSQRPVASMRPGASPTPPPVEDHSYPASWGFMPTADS